MKNTSVNTKTKGVGLMRSGKGLDIVTIMGAEMIAYGEKLNLELEEVFVDRTPEDKIDRWAIKQVVKWLEQEEIKALLVRRLEDITSDAEGLLPIFAVGETDGSVNSLYGNGKRGALRRAG